MQQKVKERGLSSAFDIDSAGTYGGHAGDLPDPRMRAHAARRGYRLEHRSIRPLLPSIWIAMQRMRSWGYLNATSLLAAVSSAFAG